MNSEKIWTIWRKIGKRYEKYGRKQLKDRESTEENFEKIWKICSVEFYHYLPVNSRYSVPFESAPPRPITAPPRPITVTPRPITAPPRPFTVPPRPITAPPRPITVPSPLGGG